MLQFNGTNKSTDTTINDIPAGTVFEGSVQYPECSPQFVAGVWIRLHTESPSKVMAVCLTSRGEYGPYLSMTCRVVKNYRVLKNPTIVEGA
jgi:hypothetical protein